LIGTLDEVEQVCCAAGKAPVIPNVTVSTRGEDTSIDDTVKYGEKVDQIADINAAVQPSVQSVLPTPDTVLLTDIVVINSTKRVGDGVGAPTGVLVIACPPTNEFESSRSIPLWQYLKPSSLQKNVLETHVD